MKFIFLLLFASLVSAAPVGPYHLPNSKLTPGLYETTDTILICEYGYTERARSVSATKKRRVYERYNVTKENCKGGCKIDHLIPLALGGSNDLSNLWPHEYGAEWTVYEKTRLEVRLRKAVCKEQMPIRAAQECIRKDWTRCYVDFYPGQHEKKLKE